MNMLSHSTIEALVADLAPVRRLRPEHGILLTVAATIVASSAVAMRYGLRADIVAGEPGPMVIIRSGMLLLLGLATSFAVVSAARPGVGLRHDGWRWALAAALLFPFAAMCMATYGGGVPPGAMRPDLGYYCLGVSSASALLIGGLLTFWLRKGAPTAINRAAWLVGLAAGSFGTFAYSLHCPVTNIYYIGLWYSLAVGIGAIAGRMLIPPLIRW
jgi:hypothetical protein